MLVLLRGQYEVVLAFAFANVSALTAFGSLLFGKATHTSVVLRSMLAFTSTCGRKSADARKSSTDRVPKMFLKKTFWDILIAHLFRFLRPQNPHLSNSLFKLATLVFLVLGKAIYVKYGSYILLFFL